MDFHFALFLEKKKKKIKKMKNKKLGLRQFLLSIVP